jgi:hypothetical protein
LFVGLFESCAALANLLAAYARAKDVAELQERIEIIERKVKEL